MRKTTETITVFTILLLTLLAFLTACTKSDSSPASTQQPAPGKLDTTFNKTGIVTTSAVGTISATAMSVAMQPDGKIVATGSTHNGTTTNFALTRYNTDGSLDTAFGTGGIVTTAIGTSSSSANSVVIQSDGKIVAAGSTNDFALVRYNTDGSLDTSFGTGGIVTTDIGTDSDVARSIVLQSDGKIVAAGYSFNGSNDDFALVRYNTDGSLDTAFGTGGIVTTDVGAGYDDAYSVAIQSDGKIIVAGSSRNGAKDSFALVRYNTDGSLDTAFGTGGIVTTDIGADYDYVSGVAIQSDGKILAAGTASNADFALVRYDSDGSLDTSFGTGGIVTTTLGTSSNAQSVAIQADGKIVAAGGLYTGSNAVFALVRYHSNGSVDTTFGTTGIVTTVVGISKTFISIAIQSDGKIVGAGGTNSFPVAEFALVRYKTDGLLDKAFGPGGVVTTFLGTSSNAHSVALQADGKIVAAGASYLGFYDFALVRYNTNGSLDTTFHLSGIVKTAVGTSSSYAYSVAIQPDGKIIAAGSAFNGPDRNFALVRYDTNGSVDTTFGTSGIVTTAVELSSNVMSVALQSDGKIVAAGSASNGTNEDFALARYNTNGSLDFTFGTGGIVTTTIGTGNSFLKSIVIQSDGKITAAGSASNGTNEDFALARYNTDGSLDTSFNSTGMVTTAIGAGEDMATSVAIQSDGKIVAAGYSYNGTNNDFALARYNADGSLDTTFGMGGIVTTTIGSDSGVCGVAIQANGKIIAAGYSWDGTNINLALARYWP